MNSIKIKPIGFVKNNVKEPRFGNFANEISEIIVDEKFTEALDSIDDYSHVIIVQGLDVLNGTPIMDIKPYWPQYDKVENGKIPN